MSSVCIETAGRLVVAQDHTAKNVPIDTATTAQDLLAAVGADLQVRPTSWPRMESNDSTTARQCLGDERHYSGKKARLSLQYYPSELVPGLPRPNTRWVGQDVSRSQIRVLYVPPLWLHQAVIHHGILWQRLRLLARLQTR